MLVNSPHDLQAICQGFVHLSAVCSLMQIWSLKLKFLSFSSATWWLSASSGPRSLGFDDHASGSRKNSLVDTLFVSHT